jgi:hypothetical protein
MNMDVSVVDDNFTSMSISLNSYSLNAGIKFWWQRSFESQPL